MILVEIVLDRGWERARLVCLVCVDEIQLGARMVTAHAGLSAVIKVYACASTAATVVGEPTALAHWR